MPQIVFQISSKWIDIIALFGWFMMFISTFFLNHWDLFGLNQILHDENYIPAHFSSAPYYSFIKIPLGLGSALGFFCASIYSKGRILAMI